MTLFSGPSSLELQVTPVVNTDAENEEHRAEVRPLPIASVDEVIATAPRVVGLVGFTVLVRTSKSTLHRASG